MISRISIPIRNFKGLVKWPKFAVKHFKVAATYIPNLPHSVL